MTTDDSLVVQEPPPIGWSFFYKEELFPGDVINVAWRTFDDNVVLPVSKRFYDISTGKAVDLPTDSVVLTISVRYVCFGSIELTILDQDGNLLRCESIAYFVLVRKLLDR